MVGEVRDDVDAMVGCSGGSDDIAGDGDADMAADMEATGL